MGPRDYLTPDELRSELISFLVDHNYECRLCGRVVELCSIGRKIEEQLDASEEDYNDWCNYLAGGRGQ